MPASPKPQQPATFRSGTNLVLVDVYPMKDGRIIENLEQTDFEILEDGKPQKVENFQVFLDQLGVSVEGAFRSRKPLVDMLNRVMAPNDLFGVMSQDMRPWGERESIINRPEEEALRVRVFHRSPAPRESHEPRAIQRPAAPRATQERRVLSHQPARPDRL